MKKVMSVMAIVLMAGLASSAYGLTVHSLNLVDEILTVDGEDVAVDAITGDTVTTNGTSLDFWDGAVSTVQPVTGLDTVLSGLAALPSGDFVGSTFTGNVYQINSTTWAASLLFTVPGADLRAVEVTGSNLLVGDRAAAPKVVQEYTMAGVPVGAPVDVNQKADDGGAGVDDLEGVGIGPNGNFFVADDGGDDRVLEFDPSWTFVAEYKMGDYISNADPEGIASDGTHLLVSNDSSGGPRVAVFTVQTDVYDTSPPDPMPFAKEYLVISTNNNAGGDALYEVDPAGTLTYVGNIAGVPGVPNGARHAYYHHADGTLYFTEGDSPAEWKVGLQDVIDNGSGAVVTRINGFDVLGGGEAQPDKLVMGTDGEIYAHTRGGGRLHHYNPLTDVATSMGAHTAYVETNVYSVMYDGTLYAKVGDDGFKAWDQGGFWSWSAPYDVPGIDDVLGAQALAIRQSDGMFFSGRSGSLDFGYIDGSIPALRGRLAKLDDAGNAAVWGHERLSLLHAVEVSSDGMKLWVSGVQYWDGANWVSGDWVGYYDISGDAAFWDGNTDLWNLVIAPGDFPTNLAGTDWRISIVTIPGTGEPVEPIAEPTGLGVVGLALLGLRKRRS